MEPTGLELFQKFIDQRPLGELTKALSELRQRKIDHFRTNAPPRKPFFKRKGFFKRVD
jgi:hypothetical protein